MNLPLGHVQACEWIDTLDCPQCGSNAISADHYEDDEGLSWIDYRCHNCKYEWSISENR